MVFAHSRRDNMYRKGAVAGLESNRWPEERDLIGLDRGVFWQAMGMDEEHVKGTVLCRSS